MNGDGGAVPAELGDSSTTPTTSTASLEQFLVELNLMKTKPREYVHRVTSIVCSKILQKQLEYCGNVCAAEDAAGCKIREVTTEWTDYVRHVEKNLLARVSGAADGADQAEDPELKTLQNAVASMALKMEKLGIVDSSEFSDEHYEIEQEYGRIFKCLAETKHREHCKLMDNQTIFFSKLHKKNRFGCLVHLTDVALTNEQVEVLEDDRVFNLNSEFDIDTPFCVLYDALVQKLNSKAGCSLDIPFKLDKEMMVFAAVHQELKWMICYKMGCRRNLRKDMDQEDESADDDEEEDDEEDEEEDDEEEDDEEDDDEEDDDEEDDEEEDDEEDEEEDEEEDDDDEEDEEDDGGDDEEEEEDGTEDYYFSDANDTGEDDISLPDECFSVTRWLDDGDDDDATDNNEILIFGSVCWIALSRSFEQNSVSSAFKNSVKFKLLSTVCLITKLLNAESSGFDEINMNDVCNLVTKPFQMKLGDNRLKGFADSAAVADTNHDDDVSSCCFLKVLTLNNNSLEFADDNLFEKCHHMLQKIDLIDAWPSPFVSGVVGNFCALLAPVFDSLTSLKITLPSDCEESFFSAVSNFTALKRLEIRGKSSMDFNCCDFEYMSTDRIVGLLKLTSLKHLSLSFFDLTTLADSPPPDLGHETLSSLKFHMCRLTKLNTDVFAAGKFPALEKLAITSSTLVRLDANGFVGLPKLSKLHLQFNEICCLESGCFKGLAKLRKLVLLANKIEDIDYPVFDDVPNLVYLDLSDNRMSHIRSFLFKRLVNLEYLYMLGNLFEEISGSPFATCSRLDILNLSHCRLSTINADMLLGLRELRQLVLANNLIDSFCVNMLPAADATHSGKLLLKCIDALSCSELEAVERQLFCDNPDLQWVRLQNNRFESIDLGVFINLSKLTSLSLENNQIYRVHTTSDGRHMVAHINLEGNRLDRIVDPLGELPYIFDFRNNPLVVMPEHITTNEILHVPDWPGTSPGQFVTRNGPLCESLFFSRAAPLLDDNNSVTRFSVTDCLGSVLVFNASQLEKAIEEEKRAFDEAAGDRVRRMCLNNHPSGGSDALNTIETLLNMFEPANLSVLDLRWNGLEYLGNCLFKRRGEFCVPNLKKLFISGNCIKTISSCAFDGTPLLQVLDLSDNQLKSLHWSSFSRLTSLKALNLARNQLRHIDGRLLATTTILKSLSLKDNKICKLNVERLFRSCCRVLKNLDLSGNLLDNVSTFFQSSTRTLTYVEQLFVNDNRLTNIDFVRDMTNLRVLELKNNGIASLLSREQNPNTPLCINLLGRLRYLARLELGGNSLTLETADDPAAFVESIFSKLVKNNTISDDFRYDSIVLKRGHSFNRDDCRAFSSDNWANKSMEDYTNL